MLLWWIPDFWFGWFFFFFLTTVEHISHMATNNGKYPIITHLNRFSFKKWIHFHKGSCHYIWMLSFSTLATWCKSWLIEKDPDAGKDWRQEEKGTTEDAMVGWHHRLDGQEFEQALDNSEGQGSLACCGPWGQSQTHPVTEQQLRVGNSKVFLFFIGDRSSRRLLLEYVVLFSNLQVLWR